MATLNTLLVNGNSVNGLREWGSQSYLDIDEGIAGADGNFAGDNTNGNATLVTSFLLSSVNADFDSILTLDWQIRYRVSGAQTNNRDLNIRIVDETTGAILAAADSGGTFAVIEASITSTTMSNSAVTGFAYVDTGASKASWDNARVEIQLVINKNMGGDANGIEVDTLEFTGTYNTPPLDVQETTHKLTSHGAPIDFNLTFAGQLGLKSYQAVKGSQSFTGNGSTITGISLPIWRQGTLTGTFAIQIFAIAGTYGSTAIPTGSALASVTVNPSSLGTTVDTWEEFEFDAGFQTVNGTKYCIQVDLTNTVGDWQQTIRWGINPSASVHDGNLAFTDNLVSISTVAVIGLNLYSGSTIAFSQSFTGDGGLVTHAGFYIKKSGSPPGNFTVELFAHSGTFGTSSVPTGSALASFTGTAADLPTIQEWIYFQFDTAYQTVNATKYVIVITYNNGDSSNRVSLGSSNSSVHEGNFASYISSWSPSSTWDLQHVIIKAEEWVTTFGTAQDAAFKVLSAPLPTLDVIPTVSTVLAPNDTSHKHTADNVALTEKATISVNDTTHNHTADNVVLSLSYTLVVQDATHKHTSDNVVVIPNYTLVVNDTAHDQTADTVDLLQAHVLALEDSTHKHTADNVDVTQAITLVVSDTTHTHTADNVVVTSSITLVVSDTSHVHTADNTNLLQASTLALQDTSHVHTADNTDLLQASTLSVQETSHKHTSDNVDVTQAITLVVSDTTHKHTADNVDVSTSLTLVVSDTSHKQTADNTDLVQANTLSVNDTTHTHTADNIVLEVSVILIVSDTSHKHTADNVNLIQASTLSVNDTSHKHTADNVELSTSLVLIVSDASHVHTTDSVDVTQKSTLIVQGTTHKHTADNTVLSYSALLTISDAAHVHTADNVSLIEKATLVVQETTHKHTADNVTVTTSLTLTVSDTTHKQTTENVVLTEKASLTVQDTTHTHTADNVELVQANTLVVAFARHKHTADLISLQTPGNGFSNIWLGGYNLEKLYLGKKPVQKIYLGETLIFPIYPPAEPFDLATQSLGRGQHRMFWEHESFEPYVPMEFEIEVYKFPDSVTPVATATVEFDYTFDADPFSFYNWFVRAKNSDGLYSQWVQGQLDLL